MKYLLLTLTLFIHLPIYSQVKIMVGDFSPPQLPIDTISNPYDSLIKTNRFYVCRAIDIDKNRDYYGYQETKYWEAQNLDTNIIIVDYHSKPRYIKLNDIKIDLIAKSRDFNNFIPFSSYYADSIETYKTKYNIEVDLVYTGRLIESVIIYVDVWGERNVKAATDIYGKISNDLDGVLSTWIKETFLGKYNIPDREFYNELIRGESVAFYYTNRIFYID